MASDFASAVTDALNDIRREHHAADLELDSMLCEEAEAISRKMCGGDNVSGCDNYSLLVENCRAVGCENDAELAIRLVSKLYSQSVDYNGSGGGYEGFIAAPDFVRMMWRSSRYVGAAMVRVPVTTSSEELIQTNIVIVYNPFDNIMSPSIDPLINLNVKVFERSTHQVGIQSYPTSPTRTLTSVNPIPVVVVNELTTEQQYIKRIEQLEAQNRHSEQKYKSLSNTLSKFIAAEEESVLQNSLLVEENQQLREQLMELQNSGVCAANVGKLLEGTPPVSSQRVRISEPKSETQQQELEAFEAFTSPNRSRTPTMNEEHISSPILLGENGMVLVQQTPHSSHSQGRSASPSRRFQTPEQEEYELQVALRLLHDLSTPRRRPKNRKSSSRSRSRVA